MPIELDPGAVERMGRAAQAAYEANLTGFTISGMVNEVSWAELPEEFRGRWRGVADAVWMCLSHVTRPVEAGRAPMTAQNMDEDDWNSPADWRRRAETAEAALSAARARLAEAMEALEPFAKDASAWADTVPNDYRSLCFEPGQKSANPGSETEFTVGDLRRAATLYAQLTAQEPES